MGRAKISARRGRSNQITCIRAGFEPRRGGDKVYRADNYIRVSA
jgi:hypothetical protein